MAFALVFIPGKHGTHEYPVDAPTVHAAAAQAIAQHEAHQPKLPDDATVRVILDGASMRQFGYAEINSTKRQWRVRVGRVRK